MRKGGNHMDEIVKDAPANDAGKPETREDLEAFLKTPLSEEDARKVFAEQDIRRAQLGIVRQKWVAQITKLQLQVTAIDEELLALDLDRAVAFRRTLNTATEKSE